MNTYLGHQRHLIIERVACSPLAQINPTQLAHLLSTQARSTGVVGARLEGLRLCVPVLLTLVFGGWLLKEASAAGGREFTWLNRALFGERTTGFCCRQHMCVTRACLLPAWRSRYADMRGYPLA